jgi:Kelch motif/Galactose oxidase, central domain
VIPLAAELRLYMQPQSIASIVHRSREIPSMYPRFRIQMCVLTMLGLFAHAALAIDSFSYTGVLVMPRSEANANLLANGKVLIAGGRSSDGITTTAELYDPSTGLFAATGDMVTMLAYRSSALLPGGKVLFAGGLSESDGSYIGTNTAEVYDSASATFAATGSFAPVGNYLGNRWEAAATALTDGKVLVAGGYSFPSTLSSAQLYDPVTGSFAPTGNMVAPRVLHTATLLPSGKVLLAGGTDGSSSPINSSSAEIYDPGTGTFAITGAMTSYLNGRNGATATLLPDGKVLIAGGQDNAGNLLTSAELFDEGSGSFTATGNLGTARLAATASLLSDGKVLIAGGADPDDTDYSIASAELYDPATGMFSAAASMLDTRQDATATVLPGGRVLIAGGNNNDNAPLFTAELYIANVIFHSAFEGP